MLRRILLAGGIAGVLAVTLSLGLTAQTPSTQQNQSNAATQPAETAPYQAQGQQETPVEPQRHAASGEEIRTAIHNSLVADTNLSGDARKIDVIDQGGTIVLRGSAYSEQEKQTVVAKAAAIAGSEPVSDEIRVEPIKSRRPYKSGRFGW